MSKRGRRGKKATNPLIQYGYPTDKALRQEAAQFAKGSVPTVKATSRPYKRQQQQVSGWLQAALGALQDSSGQVTKAYTTAEQQQAAIDAAAQARLAGLGLGEYEAGTRAVEGARSDSAAANLISRGAAGESYAAAQPGIATGFADTAHATVQKALRDALAQRADLRQQAYMQGLQVAQSNAMQRVNFLAGRQDARTQRNQFSQQMAAQSAAQAEQAREFDISQANQWAQFRISQQNASKQARDQMIAQYGFDPTTGKLVRGQAKTLADKLGITQNEVYSMQRNAVNDAHTSKEFGIFGSQYQGGVASWKQLYAELSTRYPKPIARAAALSVFTNPPAMPPKPSKNNYKTQAAYAHDLADWNASAHRYSSVMLWFKQSVLPVLTAPARSAQNLANNPKLGQAWG